MGFVKWTLIFDWREQSGPPIFRRDRNNGASGVPVGLSFSGMGKFQHAAHKGQPKRWVAPIALMERNHMIRLTGNDMTWTTYLENKRPIEALYSKPPSLSEVRLLEVRLYQDGPQASLRFNLNEFPDPPPRKWIVGKFNRAQLTLALIDIHDFQMHGWGLNNIGDITLEEHGNGVRLRLVGQSARVDCYAQFVYVEKLSGYHDSTISTA